MEVSPVVVNAILYGKNNTCDSEEDWENMKGSKDGILSEEVKFT